jgi:putative peptidoglycan lipid II flippase
MLLTKFGGFVREVLLGQEFGTSFETDAYIIALSIPTLIFSTILAAISTSYIPVYTKIKKVEGPTQASNFTGNLLLIILQLSIFFLVIGEFAAPGLVKLLGSGLSEEAIELSIFLTRISLIMMITLGIISLLTAYLQAENEFIVPAFINIPIILIVVMALLIANLIGITGIMLANILGSIIQIFILAYFIKRKDLKIRLNLNFKDHNIKKILILTGPVLIGTGAQQINLIVDKILAGSQGEGIISALTFGSKVNELFFGLVSVTIATFIFPKLARLVTDNSMGEFNILLKNSLNIVSIIVFPIVFIVLSYSDEIVYLLFERGEFSSNSTSLTAEALFYYSIGMVFFGFRDILNRTFYSMGDTKTPMKNSLITVGCNITLSIILMQIIGFKGIALASSISGIITFFLLMIALRKEVVDFKYSRFFIDQLKVLISSFVMIIAVQFSYNNLSVFLGYDGQVLELLSLGLSTFIGIIIYLIALFIFKFNEIRILIESLVKKF